MKNYRIPTVLILVGILLAGCCQHKTPPPSPAPDGKKAVVGEGQPGNGSYVKPHE